jgi:uncharacterized protein (DUF302 family)
MMATHAGELTQDGRSLLYPASEDYATTVENIKMAIADQGLNVSNTLHISDMLNRTAKDLDIKKNIFLQAESIEFCSARWSHQMIQLNPLNLNVCPFTIAVFIKTDEPQQVYVAFTQPELLNDNGQKLTQEITAALREIVENSL